MTAVLSPTLDENHEENNNVAETDGFALLKSVFDACDHNKDGYVKIHDLVALGQQHAESSSGEELEIILGQLDQNGEGRITFEEFKDKIQDIIINGANDKEQQEPDEEEEEERPEELRGNSYAESEGFYEADSSTTASDINNADDLEHASYFARAKQSNIYSTYPPNGKRPRPAHTTLFELQKRRLGRTSENHLGESVREEGFEAFGECDDSIISEPPSGFLSPIPRHVLASSPQSYPRQSGSSLVAHSLRQTHSARASLHGSMHGSEEDIQEEGNYNFLTEEIKKLGSQLSLMKMDQESHGDKQKKIREENRMLVNRINGLEEQLSEQKLITKGTVEEETQKYRKELVKIQTEHTGQIDELQMRLDDAQQEISNLKTVEPMLRKEIEASLEERRQAQRHIEQLQNELLEKEKGLEHLRYKLKAKVDELEREREERGAEVQILTQEIEQLKFMKSAAMNQYDEQQDLLKQIQILKKENGLLKTSKDELHIQLVEQGANMELEKKSSLADELSCADKSDVLDALRGEEGENHRLKQYVEQLLSLIMQTNPLLLEK